MKNSPAQFWHEAYADSDGMTPRTGTPFERYHEEETFLNIGKGWRGPISGACVSKKKEGMERKRKSEPGGSVPRAYLQSRKKTQIARNKATPQLGIRSWNIMLSLLE